MIKILVCGGRKYDNIDKFFDVMMEHVAMYEAKDVTIISGMAKGADTLAANFAKKNGCKLLAFPAHWDKDGKAAGPIRNRRMLKEGQPDLVIAFPGGKGTKDMVDISIKAGVQVVLVNE